MRPALLEHSGAGLVPKSAARQGNDNWDKAASTLSLPQRRREPNADFNADSTELPARIPGTILLVLRSGDPRSGRVLGTGKMWITHQGIMNLSDEPACVPCAASLCRC
jgi:hypothetical protein